MTLTGGECITVAEQLGVERVIWRGVVCRRDRGDSATTMPLEVFVHGLCASPTADGV
ncbi:MAG: hypothetical protein U0992_15635 [Planctomycetaceae bacterium]